MAYVMLGRPKRKEDLFITEDFDPVEVILDFDVSTEDLKWSVHQYQDYEW